MTFGYSPIRPFRLFVLDKCFLYEEDPYYYWKSYKTEEAVQDAIRDLSSKEAFIGFKVICNDVISYYEKS